MNTRQHTAEGFRRKIQADEETRIEKVTQGVKYWMSLSDEDFEATIMQSEEKRSELAFILAYEKEILGTDELNKRIQWNTRTSSQF